MTATPARRGRTLSVALSIALVAAQVSATLVAAARAATPAPPDTRRDQEGIAIRLDEREVRSAGIATTSIERERGEVELSLPGTVAIPPQQLRVVAAPAGGLVEAMLVAADETVTAGQSIARLRSPDLVEAQRQYLAALADEALATDRLRRTRLLWEGRVTPERELRIAETEASHAKSRLDERSQILGLMEMSEADIEALRNSRRIVSAVTIHAPMAGTVVSRNANPGQRVEAAAPVFTIARLEPLWVNIQVPAARLPAVDVGDAVVLPAYGVQGRIIRIGRTVDQNTQSAVAVAEISSGGGLVRPGLAVAATIRIGQNGTPQWSVPASAVVRHRDRSWVFVREENGFRARPVQVIAEAGGRASVRANLAETDRVADRGILALLAELAAVDQD
ncbi:Cation efflux system protein CusB [Rhodoplanes serenus]|uniref:Cation efflux system protein CusB n=1 Tax=Rhodoplanes serenus TaxID=200615 RepID=A0A447CPP6_9BRAD|nr:efflux RND transporter periplasmic adaptor subunit [Rhodoplanes serenus]VCU07130.1 Cation efflux system protein CusB [Rhodoplanes serenus]